MILLPDIIINGRDTLSVQDPYTLNGYIVTDISEIIYDFNGRHIKIYNEDGYAIKINYEELMYRFQRRMHDFIIMHGSHTQVHGRRDVYDWNEYSIDNYYEEIKRQCDRINQYSYNSSLINALRNDLRSQGRYNRVTYTATTSNGSVSANGRLYATSSSISGSASGVTIGYINNPFYSGFSTGIDTGYINDSAKKEHKYIHQYNYKPEYIHYYMPDEDQDTTLLLGAEIEVDCGGESDEHAKRVLEIMCGTDKDDSTRVLENKMYCMHDGSLKAGLEFASMPSSLEYHKNKMNYKEMFKYLDEHGYKAHDTTTCGLHIHADRKYLGKSKLVQQLTISKILYILEKFNDEICVIARRNNNYSKFVGKNEVNESLDKLYVKYYSTGKRVALNLQHKDTVEFRCFKGTLKYETFILTLEFVKDIIDYAKSVNVEEIELIQWSDLMNTFSDELKNYYNDRIEKEKNKKKEESDKVTLNMDSIYSTAINTLGSLMTLAPSTAQAISTDISYSRLIPRLNNPVHIEYQTSSYESAYRELTSHINEQIFSEICSSVNRNTENSTVKELKSKIETLKKKIKYSTISTEKKMLQKELNEAQKALKKEKKRIKNSNQT